MNDQIRDFINKIDAMNEKFLNLYKRLETLLEGLYPHHGSDSVFWLREHELKKSDLSSKRQRAEEYNIVRQVRNILSHNEVNLSSPFTVSKELIEFLESEIAMLENEKHASDLMVPYEKMLYAELNDNVRGIAAEMVKRGITNVPVLKDKVLIGIFNGHALLKMIYQSNDIKIDSYTQMKDIMMFIDYRSHMGIRYEFVKADDRLEDLSKLFKRNSKGKTELLLVNESGNSTDPVIGVISPHDVLEENK